MKKFMFAILAIATVAFNGCGKEDTESLEGTTWYDLDSDVSTRYMFINNSECESRSDGILTSEEQIVQYTYEYKHPEVKINFISSNVFLFGRMIEFADLKGVINGNEMTLTNTSTNENIGVITKL